MEIMKSIVLMFLKVAVNVRDSHVKRPGMNVTSLLDNQLKVCAIHCTCFSLLTPPSIFPSRK